METNAKIVKIHTFGDTIRDENYLQRSVESKILTFQNYCPYLCIANQRVIFATLRVIAVDFSFLFIH